MPNDDSVDALWNAVQEEHRRNRIETEAKKGLDKAQKTSDDQKKGK